MTPVKPSPSNDDFYTRQARKMEEFEQSVLLVITIVAAALGLLNLWQPFL